MKATKFLSVLFCGLTALCVTSCINDDDDNEKIVPLTKEQVAQCYQMIKGNYTGHLVFSVKNAATSQNGVDSVATSWSVINDSTITIDKFPAKLIADVLTNANMKEALAKADPQTLTCYYGFISNSPIQFLVNPMTLNYTLNYGGAEHKVSVAFYVNSPYSFGAYDHQKTIMEMQLLVGAVYEDGKTTTYLRETTPLVFSSKKKTVE